MDTWWPHIQTANVHDRLTDYLEGKFKDAIASSFVYLAEIHCHPDFLKIGFSQIQSNEWIESERHYKRILYRTCDDEVFVERFGDLPRAEAWLIEQYLLSRMTDKRERIPELEIVKARGFTETVKVPQGHERERTLEWIKREIYCVLAAGDSGWVKMMNALTKDKASYDLYEIRKLEVVRRYREQVEKEVQNEMKERKEYEKKLFQEFKKHIDAERYDLDFMSYYNFIDSD